MIDSCGLHHLLDASAQRWPDRVAIEDSEGGRITYRDLLSLSDRVCDRLVQMGVTRGDRVGIHISKSIDALAAIFGTLKAGGVYVPVDPTAPPRRNAYIFGDCSVRAAIVERQIADALRTEMAQLGADPIMLLIGRPSDGTALDAVLQQQQEIKPAATCDTATTASDDLAYILYTSGSTGNPKGVMLSHLNALSFIDWCTQVIDPTEYDRFSSHAPFHFDLSILDIYVALKHGATLVLVGHQLGKDPILLASEIAEKRISVWYSTPSILGLLVQYGDLSQHNYSALRMILFAGEVFPIKHLRTLRRQIPHPRYLNLYGPTETNVCTFYEVKAPVDDDRAEPYPIGKVCSHLRSRVIDDKGNELGPTEEGELCIHGPAVARGYWNLCKQTEAAFIAGPGATKWYRTGDMVVTDDNGDFLFRGRHDRMVKKRGYRVELGEIEACLYSHPMVSQAAVVALPGEDGIRIKAFVSLHDGERLSIIAVKSYCARRLPVYMVPDLFSFEQSLPTTSTDKVDYQQLLHRG